jgi:hypothetical protein
MLFGHFRRRFRHRRGNRTVIVVNGRRVRSGRRRRRIRRRFFG